MKTWFILAVLISSGVLAFGQGIQYQAVARNAEGEVLANQSLTILFSIYPGGTITTWYEEEHDVVTDAFGQFALVIGEGTPLSGDWLAVNWAAGPPDLGVQLDTGAGLVDLGRAPLQSVPHSFFALRAALVDQDLEDLTNVDAAAPADGQVLKFNSATQSWIPANDNVSSGSAGAVNTSPRLRGDGTTANPLDLAGQGAQSGQVLKWNGSAWTPDDDAGGVTYVGGSGIAVNGNVISNTGDVDPDDDITQNSNAGGDLAGRFDNLTVVGLRGRPLVNTSPSTGQVLKWNGSAWAPGTDLSGGTSFWSAGNANSIFFDNGFVGVGTNNPLARLHVNGGDLLLQDDFPVLTLNGSGANKIITFRQGNIEQGGLVYSNALGLKGYIGEFSPSSTWVLNPNGNFGVGLNTPEEKLHVDGGIRFGNTDNNQPGTIRWTGSDFQGFRGNQWVSLTEGGSFWSENDGNIFFNSGRVGIGAGAEAPRALLDLVHQSSAANPHLWLQETGESSHARINLGNKDAPNQRLWIMDARSGNGSTITPEFRILYNTGTTAITKFSMTPERITLGGFGENVGIGLGNPSERLHVLGGVRIGNTTGTGAGTIRWTGTDFEGRKGNEWVSLTGGGGSSLWSKNGSDLFYIDGLVGIGTKTPGRLLTLSRPAQAAQYQLELRNEGSITNGNFNGIIFTQGATGSTRLASIQVNYHNNGQPDMAFNLRNESNVVYLEAGGNVGINTNNPGTRLDVNGDIRTNGEVRRTTTGNANLVPIAYGNINSSGKINAGTGNFSVSRTASGRYEITINGENFFFEDYIVNVSLAGDPGFISYSSISGKLLIQTSNLAGIVIDADRPFSFVVYKP